MAKEEYEWRREVLDQQRDQVKEQMARKRLELSHLEEHIRELERRWRELQEAAADLQRRIQGQDAGQEASRAELEQLQQEVRAAQEALEAAKNKVAKRPTSYAIVPYDGPNGTRRRPIYIECTAQGVILQPEGIVLGAKDFDGPLGPGNPLDAALRGIREYYAQAGLLGSQGEPYPLLIVRPGGVEAYAAARTAMRTWDDEFGYELVDETMQLKYPEPDPVVATAAEGRDRRAVPPGDPGGGHAQQLWTRTRTSASWPHRRPAALFRKADAGGPQGGPRTGGFGRGGDRRFADGQSIGSAAGEPSPMTQPVRERDAGEGQRRRNARGEDRHRRLPDGQDARAKLGIAPTHGQRHRRRAALANCLSAGSPDHSAGPGRSPRPGNRVGRRRPCSTKSTRWSPRSGRAWKSGGSPWRVATGSLS